MKLLLHNSIFLGMFGRLLYNNLSSVCEYFTENLLKVIRVLEILFALSLYLNRDLYLQPY